MLNKEVGSNKYVYKGKGGIVMLEDSEGMPRKPVSILGSGLFRDRVITARQSSQIGFILIQVDPEEVNVIIDKLNGFIRAVDSYTEIRSGNILILITRLCNEGSMNIVLERLHILFPAADYNLLNISSLFVPYAPLDYYQLTQHLELTFGLMTEAKVLVAQDNTICKGSICPKMFEENTQCGLVNSYNELKRINSKLNKEKVELEKHCNPIEKVEKNHTRRKTDAGYKVNQRAKQQRRNDAGYNDQEEGE